MEQELWALPFVWVLLRTTEFCLGFVKGNEPEMESPPFSQIIQHPNKSLFPFSPASASRA